MGKYIFYGNTLNTNSWPCCCIRIIIVGLLLITLNHLNGQTSQKSQLPQISRVDSISRFSNLLIQKLQKSKDNELLKVEILTSDLPHLKALCTTTGTAILFESANGFESYLICELTKKQLLDFAKDKAFIAAEFIRVPSVELKQEGCDFTLNQINLIHHYRPDVEGRGLSLSIKENNFDTSDIDFVNRYFITPLTSALTSLHATNMASISAGGGISDPTALGVAWDASLTSSDFANLLPDPDAYFEDYGITVQNHSYGTGIENYYGLESKAYDESCSRLTTLIHIFSSGNSGNESPTNSKYSGLTGWANITGQFKQSKNTITVGAVDSIDHIAPLSSRGPAFDGRIKPELVAYGHGGTSGAAALVSGLSVLLQEEFQKENAATFPPSSLIKAVLVNTALDIGRPGPDFENGFGSVRGYEALKSIEEHRYLTDTVLKGDINTHIISVPENMDKIKLTVAWTDPAATINATHALINDLDLTIKSITSGEIWHPWILSTFPHPDSLSLPATSGTDTINNIEQITLLFPESGEYEISVDGNKIKNGMQEFSLTWLFDARNRFQWTYPTGSDFLLPGRKNILRWNATGQHQGKIEFKYTDQTEWQLIVQDLNPLTGWINWNTPLNAGLAQLRWTNQDTAFLSDTFVVAEPLRPKVGFLCPDSLLIYWENINRADSFEIVRLGQRHLEHLKFTKDTFFIKKGLNPGTKYFAVAPVFKDKHGPNSYGFNYSTQGAGCYINAFYLRFISDGKAYLEADLGTLYNVTAITLEKWMGSNYTVVATISPVEELNILLESDKLKQGVNHFRVTILLKDGTSSMSDDVVVYYLTEHEIIVFPNPAFSNHDITILSKSNESFSLQIVDDFGRTLIEYTETENPQVVSMPNLLPGHYTALILYDSGQKDAEDFIVVH